MKQRGGCLWLLVGLFLALLAGGLAFTAMLKATSAEPAGQAETRAPVVVVARDVPPRTVVRAEDLITKEMPLSAIPENAVVDQEAAIGKVTTGQLIAGEILLQPRVIEPGQPGPKVSFNVDPGKVVMAFPAADLMSRTGILQPGDVIDFLFTIEVKREKTTASSGEASGETATETENITFWSLQKVSITAIVLPPEARNAEDTSQSAATPQAILVALDPQDALVLKHLKDIGGITDIVLRAQEDDKDYETTPIDPAYLDETFDLTPED